MHALVRRGSGNGFRATLLSGLMTYFHNRLHSSHFSSFEPDLDAVWVGGRFCEDVFDNPARQFPTPLIWLLPDVYPQPCLDVFAVLTVHSLSSLTGVGDVPSDLTEAYRLLVSCVAMRSGTTVMSTRGSTFQHAK